MKDLIPITSEPPQVDIEGVDEKIPADAEVVHDLQEVGFVKFTEQKLQIFRKLGAHQNGHGILKTQRGMAFLTQARLVETIETLHRLLIEGVDRPKRVKGQPREETRLTTEDACKLGHEIAFAASKLTESQELMNRLRAPSGYAPPPLPGDKPEAPANAAFPSGAVVIGSHSTVQIQQRSSEPEKPIEKNQVGA